MTCPKCCQSFGQPAAEGKCPLCGFDLRPYRRRLTQLYSITTGFFVCAFAYCAVVYLLDSHHAPRPGQQSHEFLTYALLVAAVLMFGFAMKLGQRFATTTTMDQLQRLFVIKMSLIEAITVYGLLLYFLFGSVQWFVTFLALSLLGFVQTAAQMPAVVEQLGRLAVLEEGAPGQPRAS